MVVVVVAAAVAVYIQKVDPVEHAGHIDPLHSRVTVMNSRNLSRVLALAVHLHTTVDAVAVRCYRMLVSRDQFDSHHSGYLISFAVIGMYECLNHPNYRRQLTLPMD